MAIQGRYILYGNDEFFNGKLSDTEKQLVGGKVPFLRIHQFYLVNYHSIKSRSRSQVTMIDGTILPISEDRKKEVGKRYTKLLAEKGRYILKCNGFFCNLRIMAELYFSRVSQSLCKPSN